MAKTLAAAGRTALEGLRAAGSAGHELEGGERGEDDDGEQDPARRPSDTAGTPNSSGRPDGEASRAAR